MNFMKLFFPRRKGKRQGPVAISTMAAKKTEQQRIDQAIDALHAELLAVKPAPGPSAPNPGADEEERKRREEQKKRKQKISPIQQMQNDHAQERKYFEVGLADWQVQQIVSKRDYRFRMELNDFVRLYDTIINHQVKDMYSLDALDDQTRAIVLAPVVDKATFDRLVAKCWAISGMCPEKPGIHRSQWIADRLDKIVSKKIK